MTAWRAGAHCETYRFEAGPSVSPKAVGVASGYSAAVMKRSTSTPLGSKLAKWAPKRRKTTGLWNPRAGVGLIP
jgi:hypothetical protein